MTAARIEVDAGPRPAAAGEGPWVAAPDPERARRLAEARAALGALYPFQGRFLDHGGVLQHVLDEGDPHAPPCLCLHGNPTWSFAWRRLVPALARAHRVVVPDHVGMGLSDAPADYAYRLERHVENVERLVLALGLERITLVMHDWGGAIGMGFARRHPERVARLVFLNTAAFPSKAMPLRIALCRVPGIGPFAVLRLNAFARAATVMATARGLAPDVRRGYLWPYQTPARRLAVLRFVQDIPLDPTHPSHAELEAIDASLARFADRPTCLIWGERDWCFTPSFRRAFEARFPRAESHPLSDAGHLVFEDAPEAVEARLQAFLARRPLA